MSTIDMKPMLSLLGNRIRNYLTWRQIILFNRCKELMHSYTGNIIEKDISFEMTIHQMAFDEYTSNTLCMLWQIARMQVPFRVVEYRSTHVHYLQSTHGIPAICKWALIRAMCSSNRLWAIKKCHSMDRHFEGYVHDLNLSALVVEWESETRPVGLEVVG